MTSPKCAACVSAPRLSFSNKFKLKVNANLEEGGPNDHQFGYDGLDVAKLTYSAGDILGFEDVALHLRPPKV